MKFGMEGYDSGVPKDDPEAVMKVLAEQDAEIGLHEWNREVIEEEKAALEEQLGIDHLTGMKSRGVFDRELEQSLRKAREEHRRGDGERSSEVSLVFVDFDHFKQINDTYGHQVGDEVLKKASALLLSAVREEDVVARYGGEEFVVLFRAANKDFAASAAEKFRLGISELMFESVPELKVTASFGVASSESSTDAGVLLKQADEALYTAKHGGRNRVEVYQSA